jgi:hypothetical protein
MYKNDDIQLRHMLDAVPEAVEFDGELKHADQLLDRKKEDLPPLIIELERVISGNRSRFLQHCLCL